MFRGREQTHPERGEALLMRLAEDVAELGIDRAAPQQDGRNMTMLLAPNKKKPAAEAAAVRSASARLGRARSVAFNAVCFNKPSMPKMKTHSGAKKRFRKTGDRQAARAARLHEPQPRARRAPSASATWAGRSRSPSRTSKRVERLLHK